MRSYYFLVLLLVFSNCAYSQDISLNGKLKANVVRTGNIVDGAIDSLKIKDGSITSAKIADAAVTTNKLFTYIGLDTNSSDNSSVFNNALNSNIEIRIPKGTYQIGSTISLSGLNNVEISGAGKYLSTIKAGSGWTGANNELILLNGCDSVIIRDIGINAIDYYPANDTTTGSVSVKIDGIKIINSRHIVIEDCYFYGMTHSSIWVTAATQAQNSNNITFRNNVLVKGGWSFKPIAIYASDGDDLDYTDADLFNVTIESNFIGRFGNQKELYPGTTHISRYNAIHLDNLRNSYVINNKIDYPSGGGIRLEQSEFCVISGNNITEAGGAGINIYNDSFNNTVEGNTIHKFGRIPGTSKLVEYSGSYYIPRVYMTTSEFGIPSNPSITDSGFVEYNHPISGETDSIPTYDNSVTLIVPQRGVAGIYVSQRAAYNTISNNVIVGDTTTTGGLYNYEGEYGIAIGWHPNNAGVSNGGYCTVTGNIVRTVQVYDIWLPAYAEDWEVGSASYQKGTNRRSNISANEGRVINEFPSKVTASFYRSTSANPDTIVVTGSGVRLTNETDDLFLKGTDDVYLTFAGDSVIVGQTGYYLITGGVSFYTNSTDTINWVVGLEKNGTELGTNYSTITSTDSSLYYTSSLGIVLPFAKDDVIALFAKQQPGGNQNMILGRVRCTIVGL